MENYVTPVGRLVQGSLTTPRDKNMEGHPLTNKDGTPRVQYYAAIAILKTDPAWAALWAALWAAGAAAWPQGQYQQPGFAWKVLDGDTPENAEKEGFPGCYILKTTNGFPPKCWGADATTPLDPAAIKRGDYIRIAVTAKGNSSGNRPGMFVNLQMVQFSAYGPEIIGGPDGAAVFGAAAPAVLPPGASATPVAPANQPPVAAYGAPPVTPAPVQYAPPAAPVAQYAAPPAAPVPPVATYQPPAPPAAPVQPHTDFLTPGQPAAPLAPPATAAPLAPPATAAPLAPPGAPAPVAPYNSNNPPAGTNDIRY